MEKSDKIENKKEDKIKDKIRDKINNNNEFYDKNLSFSMYVDCNPSSKNFNNIQPRILTQWVDDETASKCNKCNCEFGWRAWKHHCRRCGYIFCHPCSNKSTIIPKYVRVPKPTKSEKIYDGLPKRVCDDCFNKLKQLEELKSSLESIETLELNINEIRDIAKRSELHSQYVNYYLSNFREIQYLLPNHEYNNFEKHVLWINRKLFIGHCIWMTQLFKSINYKNEHSKISELMELLQQHDSVTKKNKNECWNLMCARSCEPKFSSQCSLMLLDRKILCPEIQEYAIKMLDHIDEAELLCYITYLVENAIQSPFSVLSDWIINKSAKNLTIANRVFWCIQNGIRTDISFIATKYNALLISWNEKVPPNIKTEIINGHKFVRAVRKNYDHIILNSSDPLNIPNSSNQSNSSNISNSSDDNIKYENKITSPTDPHMNNLHVMTDKIKILKSKTRPIRIPLANSENKIEKILLYKREDIRKDQIVMDIIRLMDIFLKRNNINIDIITYNVQSTGSDEGLLEIVQNSKTLSYIQDKQKQKLIHHIIYKQPEAGIRLQRFINSCAFCSIMTGLLGVGDRHLDNIMISPEGILFHIDFGYILGQDPKLISTSNIRITLEMSEVLGNLNGEVYKDFQELAGQMYNCLRQYVNTFTCLLNLFSYMQPSIKPKFTQSMILNEIEKRFVPGENCYQAKIQISNRIDNSTTKTFRYQIIDFFHRQMDMDEGFFRHFNSSNSSLLKGIWDLIPSFNSKNNNNNNNNNDDDDTYNK